MNLKILILFCFISLLNLFAAQEFPKISNFENFHSRVALRRTDANDKTVTFIEEYWDLKQSRGRLEVTRNNISQIILYNLKTKQYSDIIGYNCLSTKLRNNEATGWDVSITDEAIVDFDENNPLIIGPSAAWRKITRALKDKEAVFHGDETVRGMAAKSWSLSEDKLTFKLYFAAEGWNAAANDAPLRITVSGTYNKIPIDLVFDYYVFEKFDTTYYKFFPIVGIGCDTIDIEPGKIIPKIPWSDFSTELEIVESTTSGKDLINFGPLQVNLYVDLKNNVSRTDITSLNAHESVIHDLNRGIIYNKKPSGDCLINPDNPTDLDLVDNVEKAKSISALILLDREYYYLGSTYVRGVYTDIWESVSYNETIDKIPMTKVVVTYFITADKKANLDSLGNQLPVKFTRAGYISDSEGLYRLVMKQDFNMFNFQKLYYGKNFQDVFNIENCIIDDDDKKYFVFSSLLDEHLKIMDRKYAPRYANLVKKTLTDILTDTYGVSPLRVPSIDFNYQDKSIRIEALILEKPSFLLSYDKKEDRKPISKDAPYKLTLDECAEATIKRKKSTGFKYCNKMCYIMTYDPNEKGDPIEEKECEFYLLRSLNGAVKDLAKEPTLNLLRDQLFDSIKTLSLNVTDWKKNTILIPIDDIVVSDKSTSLLSGELLYARSVSDQRLQLNNSIEFSAETLGDCYTYCKNDKDIECQTFSYCSTGDDKKCRLSSVLISDDTNLELLQNNTESKEQCNIYTMNYMNKYEAVAGERGLLKGFITLKSVNYRHECARMCSTQGQCSSFQFCESGNCAVSEKAFQDFTKDDLKTVDTKEICDVYETKDVNLFVITGSDLVSEKIELTKTDVGVEECAKLCYEMQQSPDQQCLSFNYCPTTATGARSNCQLSSASVLHGASTVKNSLCKNFDRNVAVKNKTSDQSNNREQSSNTSNKMSSKSFMALIFGMLFVGLILGIVGFFGYRAYQSRREDNDGFGVSVRFIRHQDE